MSGRLSIEERIKIVELHNKFRSFIMVQREWKNHFTTNPPCNQTIARTVQKFEETGSVHDRKRSARSRTANTEENLEKVTESLKISPSKSIRQGALAIGMSNTSYYRLIREAGFRPYRPTAVQKLSEADLAKRVDFCEAMLQMFAKNDNLVNKIIWSDESQFMLNGIINRHNCCYWAQSNPQQQIAVSNSKQGVMVWCGMTSAGLIGPYFFGDSVTSASYLQMLSEFIWPLIMRRGLYFQQDGAAPHYANDVRDWLNAKLPDRWIGRKGPIEWPPRSPDLTPPDLFLWGYLKDKVYVHESSTTSQLMDRIQQACAEVPLEMCRRACQNVPIRLKQCLELKGKNVIT